jgi:hypothetical protein
MAARAGWSLTSGRVARNPDGLDLPGLLDRIESELGNASPAVQWTMNSCLAGIGIHFRSIGGAPSRSEKGRSLSRLSGFQGLHISVCPDLDQRDGAPAKVNIWDARLVLFSDTHGVLRPEATAALRGVDFIVHAGDVGSPEVLFLLAELAPVTAVPRKQ